MSDPDSASRPRPTTSGADAATTPGGDAATTPGGDAATTRLSRAVLALAEPPPPSTSAGRAKALPGHAENLVFEFDEAYTAWVEGFVALPEEAQLIALQRVDRQLATMVAAKDAGLWTDQARREASAWHEVRALAGEVAALFGWLPIAPPDGSAAGDRTS